MSAGANPSGAGAAFPGLASAAGTEVAEVALARDTQRAIINILEDAADERIGFVATQKAIVNVLEDSAQEQLRSSDGQRAMLNILEDSALEQLRSSDTQRAMQNILEDVALQSRDLERVNGELAAEIAVRKRTEESLIISNKELEAFSYSVSHDLRAPLRSIDGFGQALMEDCADQLDQEARDYLGRIRAATQRMAMLIDELLKLARISRSELHYEPVDLSAMANAILTELREAEPARRVECVVGAGIVARGDDASLRTALENLVSNAWKFTGRKEHAHIEFGATRQHGQPVYFVRDDGAGFDMAYAGKLFGVFQRLHSDKDFPGVGVGLAIVQRVILRHGGRAWAESALNKGATFYFTLSGERKD